MLEVGTTAKVAAVAASVVALAVVVKRNRKFAQKASRSASVEEQLLSLNRTFPAVVETKDWIGICGNEQKYIDFLGKLIGEAEFLQNFPPENIPQEGRVAKHVLDQLKPYTKENGGPLEVREIQYVDGRSNIIIKYPGASSTARTIGFIGSHMDVVPATPDSWERNPFTLTVEGDKLYGRGTTDCLGHIALITLFFEELAKKKPNLQSNVTAVFIASEEATHVPFVGVDGLKRAGELEELKDGTTLWIDASDSEPCIGTAGALQWHLTAVGKRFHSGFPDASINPIELVNEALKEIQSRFYKDFPPHPEETRYKFRNPTTIKPTQMKCAKGGLNQIPSTATMSGDIRLTPFYETKKVIDAVNGYVEELNRTKFASLDQRGPCSKYELPAENRVGKLQLEWGHDLDGGEIMSGVACYLDSPGFLALCDSIKKVRGSVKPYSICGSLPLVDSMQAAGFDLQITGFGRSDAYHAENEYCLLSDMMNAFKILSTFVSKMENQNKSA